MKPILFSVSYAGLWGQHPLDLAGFLHKAHSLGYAGVELMCKRPHLSVLDVGANEARDLRKLADDLGLEICTLAAYTDFTLGRKTETPAAEMQLLYVRQLAELAAQLGAKLIRVFSGYTVDPDSYAADWDICVRSLRECSAIAAEQGVTLGLQNHHDIGVGVDAYEELLRDIDHPNCRAMFDPWSPALHGEDLRAAAERLAPRMAQTTLADYVRLRRYQYLPGLVNYQEQQAMVRAVPLGEGEFDLAGFFAGLRAGGFDGYVAYEMCSPVRGGGSEANLDQTARQSLAQIHRWIAG